MEDLIKELRAAHYSLIAISVSLLLFVWTGEKKYQSAQRELSWLGDALVHHENELPMWIFDARDQGRVEEEQAAHDEQLRIGIERSFRACGLRFAPDVEFFVAFQATSTGPRMLDRSAKLRDILAYFESPTIEYDATDPVKLGHYVLQLCRFAIERHLVDADAVLSKAGTALPEGNGFLFHGQLALKIQPLSGPPIVVQPNSDEVVAREIVYIPVSVQTSAYMASISEGYRRSHDASAELPFPAIRALAVELGAMSFEEAVKYAAEHSGLSKTIPILNIAIDGQVVSVVGPIAVVLVLIFLCIGLNQVLTRLSRENVASLTEVSWFAMFPEKSASLAALITFLVLPVSCNALVTRTVRDFELIINVSNRAWPVVSSRRVGTTVELVIGATCLSCVVLTIFLGVRALRLLKKTRAACVQLLAPAAREPEWIER